MDNYSSGDDLIIKTRKPYTITKQRERWTEEEHNRFLEALKLYGRAWQRIEEHIGTKTAVQIRSHAQKFFSKLEKEAQVKGVPIGQAIDIEIPPPRPKRKPSNPYPRKSSATSSPNTQIRTSDGKQIPPSSSHTVEQVVDSRKEQLPEKPIDHNGESSPKETNDGKKYAKALTLFNEEPSLLVSEKKLSNFKELVPLKSVTNKETREMHASNGHKPNVSTMVKNDSENETDTTKKFPRHAPVQILDGSLAPCSQAHSSDVSYQEPTFHQTGIPCSNPSLTALFNHPTGSTSLESQTSTSTSTNNHNPIFPNFHPPFTHLPNTPQEYSSFPNVSSTFSSMIVSSLFQNPAVHAAASFAASFWPCPNPENPIPSATGFPPRPVGSGSGPGPSVVAIAAATVAAATAWWAANGLLPLCTPLHAGFSFPPNSSTTSPIPNFTSIPVVNIEREENSFRIPGSKVEESKQELSEALHSASKSSVTSSSDSRDTSCVKMDLKVEGDNNEKSDQKDMSKGKNKKQVDRSSCGSNTPSGSDVETDALGKNVDGKEEVKELDVTRVISESSSRRNRIASNVNDSWKEVSEGGRLAFQALFSREVLPQSFSPPKNSPEIEKKQETNKTIDETQQNTKEINNASQLDLNNTWDSCSSEQRTNKNNVETRKEKNLKNPTFSDEQEKLKTNKTGFKPYKRCSMEARENSRVINPNYPEQEKCSKRLRLEGEAASV